MASAQSSAAANLARTSGSQSQAAYDVGIPALQLQRALLQQATAEGGEPGYLKAAFGAQRAGLTEGGLTASLGGVQGAQAQAQGALQRGNTSAGLTPDIMGARMAQSMYSSRLQEGLGQIEQSNKLLQMGLGQSAQAGSEALGAAGNELRAISMMPNYNPTLATALAVANAGGAIYGGFQGAAQRNQGSPSWGSGLTSAYGNGTGATGLAPWYTGGQ